jgi:AcrR family transcriptional regulator
MDGSDALKATDGRALKRKGATTRHRILDALEELLQDTPPSELRVSRVAAAADVAAATFYSYFPSLDDAFLALVQQDKFAYAAPALLLRAPWPKERILERARAFAHAYFDFWDEHRAVLALRNMKGEEGDPRFVSLRLDHTLPILDAVAEKLAVAKAEGLMPQQTPSSSFAAVLMAALERNASGYVHVPRHLREDLIEASAMTFAMWLGAPASEAAQ